jgi:hypothetical protein
LPEQPCKGTKALVYSHSQTIIGINGQIAKVNLPESQLAKKALWSF